MRSETKHVIGVSLVPSLVCLTGTRSHRVRHLYYPFTLLYLRSIFVLVS